MTTSRISAPVDLLYTNDQILIRRIPGFADLTNRISEPGGFDLRAEIEGYRTVLAKAELPPLTILKARRSPHARASKTSPRCEARFDVGLGAKAHVVILDVKGDWITAGPEAHITEAAAQLRQRLDGFAWDKPYRCSPSLCYVCGEHPKTVQFELTTHCNLRCGYCTNRLLTQKNHTALPEVFRMLDAVDFTHIRTVDLTGLGESLLHPGLEQIVAEIRRRGADDIRLVTNGTIATVDRCRRLLEAGLTSISVSFDTLDPARFNGARAGGKFETIQNNLVELARFRQLNREIPFNFQIKAVLFENDPYKQAEEILTFSAQHQLDRPAFNLLDSREASAAHYQFGLEPKEWAVKSRKAVLDWIKQRWAQLTNNSNGATSPSQDDGALPWTHRHLEEELNDACDWAVESAYVGGDGYCIACCEQIGDLPRPRIASIFEKSLASLWNDELLYAHRLPLSLGLIPPNCQGCDAVPAEGRSLALGG